MGCDIHLRVEVRDGTKWRPAERRIKNRWYDPKAEADDTLAHQKTVPAPLYDGRNYHLFAILADVRNGEGFAGCRTGEGFVPISNPKGLPRDVSADVQQDSDGWGCDGHSHSWLTLGELENYDWEQTSKLCGVVSLIEFAEAVKNNGQPRSYAGDVFGRDVIKVSVPTMRAYLQKYQSQLDAYLAAVEKARKILGEAKRHKAFQEAQKILKPLPAEVRNAYTTIEWTETYQEAAGCFVPKTMPKLRKLAKKFGGPEMVRIVFWFDN